MDRWFRLAAIALILISFLRRILKANARRNVPRAARRPAQGRKNDFRDVPPPPENPELG